MIFLSASIPYEGREFYGTTNDAAIAGAVIAFARVCAEYDIDFYFGGHPAITPLILEVGLDYSEHFKEKVHIYQSEHCRDKTPKSLEYYNDIHWIDDDPVDHLKVMRQAMFGNETDCAVFIGGMKGILDEFKLLHEMKPDVVVYSIQSVGGASEHLYHQLEMHNNLLESMAYTRIFREILYPYKKK